MINHTEKVRASKGEAFERLAREISENDGVAARVVSELIGFGTQDDCEKIAVILAHVPFDGESSRDYYSSRFDRSFDKRYVELFLRICEKFKIAESEYVKVLIATGYTDVGTPLSRWAYSADMYLKRRATEDFGLVCEYLNEYDKKFRKYGALIDVDARRALRLLVDKLLYEKNIDKTAVRRALLEHAEQLSTPLMALYGEVKAKERAAIVRLLALYRNDVAVERFLKETVAADKSKTVRDIIGKTEKPPKKIGDATAFFEKAMSEGTSYTLSKWRSILKTKAAAEVADRIFFCIKTDDGTSPLVFNDGQFLDMTDAPLRASDDTPIYVLHPLDVAEDSEILAMRISQPFEQIKRRVYYAGRSGNDYRSGILKGSVIPRDEFDSNFKRLGFTYCGSRSGAEPLVAVKFVGEYAVGVKVELFSDSDAACCGEISYYPKTAIVKLNRTLYVQSATPLLPSALPRREFSELTRYAYGLFSRE